MCLGSYKYSTPAFPKAHPLPSRKTEMAGRGGGDGSWREDLGTLTLCSVCVQLLVTRRLFLACLLFYCSSKSLKPPEESSGTSMWLLPGPQ